MKVPKCESCETRVSAALVELDGVASYMCRPCTEAVQAQHSTEALCDNCHANRTIRTLPRDGAPFSLCTDCVPKFATLEDSASGAKSKRKKKSSSSANANSNNNNNTYPQFGISAEQGRRPTMEDAECAISDLSEVFPDHAPAGSQFYGVYDGHGGQRAAEFVKQNLHHKIVASDLFKQKKYEDAIRAGYAATDDDLLQICDAEQWQDGATGVVGLIVDDRLITSCVGDSELIVFANGAAKCRSFKHKPSEPTERARIQAAGGVVLFDRLGASMAVSRSFGDKVHKHPFNGAPADHMSAEPFIDSMPVADVEFFIVACDGVFDHLSYDDAAAIVSKQKKKGKSAEEAAKALVQEALGKGSTDNCTAIVVFLKEE